MSAFIIYKPGKKGSESIYSVVADVETAKNQAADLRDTFTKKGWDSWASRVRIAKPNNREFARDLANKFISQGNLIDMMNQGGTFRCGDNQVTACMSMDTLYAWADVLRKAHP